MPEFPPAASMAISRVLPVTCIRSFHVRECHTHAGPTSARPRRSTPSMHRFALVVSVLTMGMLVACGGGNDDPPMTSTVSNPTGATATAPPAEIATEIAPPAVTAEELEGFEPRTIVHANVEFTITGVRAAN